MQQLGPRRRRGCCASRRAAVQEGHTSRRVGGPHLLPRRRGEGPCLSPRSLDFSRSVLCGERESSWRLKR
uniref:Uncharacterized protein n=1 Tax=Arundo donax TaxID=35708 RepID=A0A0A8Z6W3_ARUDO